MTFNVMVPTTITDANFDASNVLENDYTAWNSATAYVIGDRVMVAGSTHKNYECVVAHTNKPPTVAANVVPAVGAYWVFVSATNRWRPFDRILSSLTTRTGDIAYRLLMTSIVTTLAVFGVTGGSVQVIGYDTDVVRRNILTYSEEFGNAVYSYTRSGIVENDVQDPFGSYQADTWIEDGTAAATHAVGLDTVTFTSGVTYTVSIYVKRRAGFGNRDIRFLFPVIGFSGSPTALFNLGTGVVTSTGGGGSATISGPDAYGYYRCTMTATADGTGLGRPFMHLYDGSITYNGNSVAGLHIFGAMLNVGGVISYQWIRGALQFGDIVYNQTKNTSVLLGGNSSEAVFEGLSLNSGDYLAVAVYSSSGDSQVGEIAMGVSYPIGDLVGFDLSIRDFSKKELDTYGNAEIIRRNFASLADCVVVVPKLDVAQWKNFLAFIRAVPVVWYATEDPSGDWGTILYGMYKEFSFPLTGATVSRMALRIEGIV